MILWSALYIYIYTIYIVADKKSHATKELGLECQKRKTKVVECNSLATGLKLFFIFIFIFFSTFLLYQSSLVLMFGC